MRKVKPVLVLLITTLFMIASSFPFASVAFAATCSGTGCDGLYASSTGCASTNTTTTRAIAFPASTTLALRRNSDCKTWWTRVTNADPSRNLWGVATLYSNLSRFDNEFTGGAVSPGSILTSRQKYNATTSLTGNFNACGYFNFTQITSPAPYGPSCAPYP